MNINEFTKPNDVSGFTTNIREVNLVTEHIVDNTVTIMPIEGDIPFLIQLEEVVTYVIDTAVPAA